MRLRRYTLPPRAQAKRRGGSAPKAPGWGLRSQWSEVSHQNLEAVQILMTDFDI